MKLFLVASYRKWLLSIGVIAGGVLFLVDKILRHTTCPDTFDASCENYTDLLFVFDSGYFIKAILLATLFLWFFPERAFQWWRWFALASIPLLTLWIVIEDAEFFGHLAASKASGVFFFSVSFLIAISSTIYNHLKLRGKK